MEGQEVHGLSIHPELSPSGVNGGGLGLQPWTVLVACRRKVQRLLLLILTAVPFWRGHGVPLLLVFPPRQRL